MTNHILPDENHFEISVRLEQINSIADAVRCLDEKVKFSEGSGLAKNTLSSLMILLSDQVERADKLLSDLDIVRLDSTEN